MRLVVLILFVFAPLSLLADWPVHQQNNQRNAKTDEHLDAPRLGELWTWRSPCKPKPAWSGPAKWDAYSGIRGLKSMRNYDPVFHVVGADGRIYFGSSVDDQVRCLRVDDGSQVWKFTTDGPVRIAPTVHDNRVYFGSDDGSAYCVQAKDGWPVWKATAKSCNRRILNDGRFISQWPVRTGVVIENRIAYFGASLLPWQESYLCAVDSATGEHHGSGHYIHRIDGATMEGPLAVAPGKYIVAPQGRVPPKLFSIENGKTMKSLDGGGGSFVVLTRGSILHGPGNKTGWMTASSRSLDENEKIASFNNANAIVVAGNVSFVLSDRTVAAINYGTRKLLWTRETDCSFALALAGNTLFAGGLDTVQAYDARTGTLKWQHAVKGRAYGIAISDACLFVSTDEGSIHCFSETEQSQELPKDNSVPAARSTESPTGLRTILQNDDDSVIGRWVFQHPQATASLANDLVGQTDGTIEGSARLERVNDLQAIRLDGQTTQIRLTRELEDSSSLPRDSMTAEAWIRIDKPANWGGIIGCIQDNGSFERGWILGYSEQKPMFGLCGSDGNGRLTYLKADIEYALRAWHHFAATYDGKEMRLYIDGKLAATSKEQSGSIRYPPTGVYSIGSYQDDNESFPLDGMIHEVVVHNRALSESEISTRYDKKASAFPTAEPDSNSTDASKPAVGPWLTFDSDSTATIRWKTSSPSPTGLRLFNSQTVVDEHRSERRTKEHSVQLKNLGHQRLYHYVIDIEQNDETKSTSAYECDTAFNFQRQALPGDDATAYFNGNERSERAAEYLLSRCATTNGLCIVLGCGDGSLMYEIAKRSKFRIVAFDHDGDRVERVRHALQNADLYGERITVHRVDFMNRVPITGHVANLVTSGSILSGDETQVSFLESQRLLAPKGVACFSRLSSSTDWMPGEEHKFELINHENARWAIYHQPEFESAGEWSHIYGSSDNTHYGGEALSNATKATDLALQWIGRPGPRYQADRNGRKPAPLSTGGRIFLQGLDRLIALDQYNGSILWSLEIPDFRRFNMPRDCGNWCADADHVYAAIRNKCWRISAATGQVEEIISLPDSNFDWGFVARYDDLLIGSCVKPRSLWTDFWGKEGWYDGTEGEVAAKVCSDEVFAIDVVSGELVWQIERSPIVNSTISVSDGHIYFVESPGAKNDRRGRLDGDQFWNDQRLVSVNARTGQIEWESTLQVKPGKIVFYSACPEETVILVSSVDATYFVYAFSARNGEPMWDQSIAWGKGKADHGSHLSRPAVVGTTLFIRPEILDLKTGEKSSLRIPVGGCGTYAATDSALFFRGGSGNNSAMFNTQRGDYTMWDRLRPDCWLSTIPAGGMLLSPEGGGGCSCGKWMETSIGFIPKSLLAKPK